MFRQIWQLLRVNDPTLVLLATGDEVNAEKVISPSRLNFEGTEASFYNSLLRTVSSIAQTKAK